MFEKLVSTDLIRVRLRPYIDYMPNPESVIDGKLFNTDHHKVKY
jgi:hypothetical protein